METPTHQIILWLRSKHAPSEAKIEEILGNSGIEPHEFQIIVITTLPEGTKFDWETD
jgi:hypothetical protein